MIQNRPFAKTCHKIRYAWTQVTQCGFQNIGKYDGLARSALFRNLHCDRVV